MRINLWDFARSLGLSPEKQSGDETMNIVNKKLESLGVVVQGYKRASGSWGYKLVKNVKTNK